MHFILSASSSSQESRDHQGHSPDLPTRSDIPGAVRIKGPNLHATQTAASGAKGCCWESVASGASSAICRGFERLQARLSFLIRSVRSASAFSEWARDSASNASVAQPHDAL